MNRREFLSPRRLASVAGPVLALADELESLPPEEAPSQQPVHLRFARKAMATTFEVILPFGAPSASASAQAALDEIDRLEAQLTVYRDSSEVSRLNSRAAQHPVRVEANLFELLALAATLHRETEGAFDVSVGALIKAWGFFRRSGRVPTPQERAQVAERIGMQHVRLDPQRQTVAFLRQGLELNLGSIGKGYALDRAAALLQAMPPQPQPHSPGEERGVGALLHGGHSSILAIGNEGPGTHGWTVGLSDPQRPECRRALVRLRNRALATSAITHQHFEHEGKKLGHLLDPRTGWPADGMLSASVTAPTATVADALATAFFILGIDKAKAYCEAHPEIGAALIAADAPQRLVRIGRAVEEFDVLRA
jgi:thiamine biosynthesis lipoprotein